MNRNDLIVSQELSVGDNWQGSITPNDGFEDGSTIFSNSVNIVTSKLPPVAKFSGIPNTGTAPLTVTFTDASTSVITSYLWDFGDTATSTDPNPTHVYSAAGQYTVKLTVSNSVGSNTVTKKNYITVNALVPPVAKFSGTPNSGTVPLTVTFTDASTGVITSYLWDFGDTKPQLNRTRFMSILRLVNIPSN